MQKSAVWQSEDREGKVGVLSRGGILCATA